MNPIVQEMMMRERHRDMLAEAKRRRLVAEYEAQFPSAWESVLTAFANGLIATGQWLKRRYGCSCQREVQPQFCGK